MSDKNNKRKSAVRTILSSVRSQALGTGAGPGNRCLPESQHEDRSQVAPKGQVRWRPPLILLILLGSGTPRPLQSSVLGCRGEADRAGRKGGGSTCTGHRGKPQRGSSEPPLQPWPHGEGDLLT